MGNIVATFLRALKCIQWFTNVYKTAKKNTLGIQNFGRIPPTKKKPAYLNNDLFEERKNPEIQVQKMHIIVFCLSFLFHALWLNLVNDTLKK